MGCKGQDFDVKDLAIRNGTNEDVPYMFKRTLRDLRNWPLVHGCPDGLYHQYMHRALEHVFTRSAVLVGHPAPKTITMKNSNMIRTGNPRRILGFLVADATELGLIVHYCNVRRSYNEHGTKIEDYRQRGIATKLVETAIDTFKVPNRVIWTLRTPMFRHEKDFRRKVEDDPRFTYNPFLFFTLLPEGWEQGIRRPSTAAQFHRLSTQIA